MRHHHDPATAGTDPRANRRLRLSRLGGTLLVAAIAVLAVSGCATAPITVPPEDRVGPLPGPLSQFVSVSEDVREAVEVESGTLTSAYGCTLRYEYHQPPATADDAGTGSTAMTPPGAPVQPGLVVLAHGFMRDLTAMRGWAAEWAARGTPTVVMSFCNSSWFNGRHARNAEDMIALAELLRPGQAPVLYAGFSAGGLSALLATEQDERAIGYLGLDPVDSGELTAGVARLRVPALFIYGAPASCNAENNMVDVMPAAQRRLALRIPYASHCSFEDPYDPACAALCGAEEPEEQAREIRRTIHALATAWVGAQLGASPDARQVFHRRTLEALEAARRVEILSLE